MGASQIVDQSFLEWIYNEDNIERIKGYEENEQYYIGDLDIKLPGNLKKDFVI